MVCLVDNNNIRLWHIAETTHDCEHRAHVNVWYPRIEAPGGYKRMIHVERLEGSADLLDQFVSVRKNQGSLATRGDSFGEIREHHSFPRATWGDKQRRFMSGLH